MPAQPDPVPAQRASMLTDAMLMATWYFQADHQADTDALVQRLIDALRLAVRDPDVWKSADGDTFLCRYLLGRPHADTCVLQLVLNRRGPMGLDGSTWLSLRQQLQEVLGATALPSLRGYTLVYQADLAADVTVDAVWAHIPPVIQRLHGPDGSPALPVLARAQVPGGHIGLLHIPLGNDGFEAATIYLALSQHDPDRLLIRRTLLGDDALLFLPDLIAHKGYAQIRQYRFGDVMETYSQRIEQMRNATSQLLNRTDLAGLHEVLTPMISQYDKLVEAVLWLQGLRISLAQQITNYRLIEGGSDAPAVVQFHRRQLVICKQDLDLLVAKGKDVLDVAGGTLNVRRAKLEEHLAQQHQAEQRAQEDRYRQERAEHEAHQQQVQEERRKNREEQEARQQQVQEERRKNREEQEARQQQMNMVIGVVGVGLALPQLIDKEVVTGLLAVVWQPVPAEGYNVLFVFGIQAVIIIILVVAVWVAWVAIATWRGTLKHQP